jgi:hypothetical protein
MNVGSKTTNGLLFADFNQDARFLVLFDLVVYLLEPELDIRFTIVILLENVMERVGNH